MYRQTGHPLPFHFCRHVQWNTCWHIIVNRPLVSSIRSRQTGQVGSSISAGVGGASGFVVSVAGGARELVGLVGLPRCGLVTADV